MTASTAFWCSRPTGNLGDAPKTPRADKSLMHQSNERSYEHSYRREEEIPFEKERIQSAGLSDL